MFAQIDKTDLLQGILKKNAGKTIKLPIGTFYIQTLNVPANTQIIIDSSTVLIGLPTETPYPLLKLSDNVQVSGAGVLDGSRTTRKHGVGIHIDSATNVRVSNIRIRNTADQGIQVFSSHNITLNNVHVSACGSKESIQYQGINLVISQQIQVANCTIENAMHGIQWWGDETNGYCENIKIYGNRVKRVTGGIWGNRGKNVTVSNNTTEKCQDVGIDFEHSFNCSAIGNIVRDCKNYGLATFYGSERITFAKNRVFQGSNYGHGIGLCGEGLSKQISFIGGSINTKGNDSCGLITVGTNIAQDILIQGMSIVTEGKNGIPIRILENNQFQIINNPLISGVSPTGISLEGSSRSLVQGNTIVHKGADSSNLGERGGVFVYFRSPAYPAQHNIIQGNRIRGFSTGINDDCWGDVNSHNRFENNTIPNLFHRTSSGIWGGKAQQNHTEANKSSPINTKQ